MIDYFPTRSNPFPALRILTRSEVLQLTRRNEDYREISAGTVISRGEMLAGNDHLVWVGDLNYRLELSGGSLENQPPTEVFFKSIPLLYIQS